MIDQASFQQEQRQRKQQIEDRMKMQRRIESLRREFEFLSKLDTADVNYILVKKQEQAALVLQRNFRKFQARKEAEERRKGLYAKVDQETVPEDSMKLQND